MRVEQFYKNASDELERSRQGEESKGREKERLDAMRKYRTAELKEKFVIKTIIQPLMVQITYRPQIQQHITLSSDLASGKTALFRDLLSDRLSLPPCEHCRKPIERFALCRNHHVVCSDCIAQCAECLQHFCHLCELEKCHCCEKKICQQCQKRCAKCGAIVCRYHIGECGICGLTACSTCAATCAACGKHYCLEHANVRVCHVCGQGVCGECQLICHECHLAFCPEHARTCEISGETLCSQCALSCPHCQKLGSASNFSQCTVYQEQFCASCIRECGGCAEKHLVCVNHQFTCSQCQNVYATNHANCLEYV